MRLYYETESICPECLRDLPARVVDVNGAAVMEKECPEHGHFETVLCAYGEAWDNLRSFYHSIHPPGTPPLEITVMICPTVRCNLDCPFCLMFAGDRPFREPSLEDIADYLKPLRHQRVTIFGGEPTLREDLPQILRLVRRSGNTPILQTNGMRLAEEAYCRELRDAGVGEVFLTYDGAKENSAEILRGKPVKQARERAIENLDRLGVPVFLSASVASGLNDHELLQTIQFSIRKPIIRGVFFRASVPLGPHSPSEHFIRADQMLDRLEKQTGGRITFQEVMRFMKVFRAFEPILGIQRCWTELFYVVFRDGHGGYETIGEILDLEAISPHLHRYVALRKRGLTRLSEAYLLVRLPTMIRWRKLKAVANIGRNALRVLYSRRFGIGASQQDLSAKTLLLNFDELCNINNCDLEKIRNCPNMTFDEDGQLIAFCQCNLDRQRRWHEAKAAEGEKRARSTRLG